ncbi:hypothetical protein NOV72_03728 [Caballeronia novacaledonica]|uniref:Uncharacterized protein n=1 Tax=Caballeronia novacaledonica TaxID=1544861 RepID=A0A2U3I8K3_9BURK|nr:hypothetical protein [Caballeronia novacaledonica]SPB16529.1 hypothetical protein NOV72_03728 [Caballeronia novacaledonica]
MEEDELAAEELAARQTEAFEQRVFDLAYFWKISPAEVMALSLTDFNRYERNALRIAEQQTPDDG